MSWIDMNALQVGHPDRMHTARTAEATDQVTRHLMTVTSEQDQVVVTSEQGCAVHDASLAGPLQIGRGCVVQPGIRGDESISRGKNVRDIAGRRLADQDRHLSTLTTGAGRIRLARSSGSW